MLLLSRLHNNGRLLDVYWRLHGKEEEFFIPYDLEMSNQEVNYVVNRAEAWRGEEGERRKIAVFDYIWEEEDVSTTLTFGKLNSRRYGYFSLKGEIDMNNIESDKAW